METNSPPDKPTKPVPHSRRIEDYGLEKDEPFIGFLVKIIHFAVRILAVLMTLLIIWGVIDAGWQIFSKLRTPPVGILTMNDILDVFGAFLAVLIAIEIFANITMYLRDDIIHVKLVMATALMAIARKVIVFDFAKHDPDYIWATGVVIFGLSIGYWLISSKIKHEPQDGALH